MNPCSQHPSPMINRWVRALVPNRLKVPVRPLCGAYVQCVAVWPIMYKYLVYEYFKIATFVDKPFTLIRALVPTITTKLALYSLVCLAVIVYEIVCAYMWNHQPDRNSDIQRDKS